MKIPINTRLRILRKALQKIEKCEADFICEAIRESWPRWFYAHGIGYNRIPSFFPEILKRKPKSAFEAWFTNDNDGRIERLDLLKNAITDLNNQLKCEKLKTLSASRPKQSKQ